MGNGYTIAERAGGETGEYLRDIDVPPRRFFFTGARLRADALIISFCFQLQVKMKTPGVCAS